MVTRHKRLPVLAIWFASMLVFQVWTAGAQEVRDDKIWGAGVVLGEPTGFTGKVFLKEIFALQASAAITFWDSHHLVAFVDFLWYPGAITENQHFLLVWYVGLGVGGSIRAPWRRNRHNDWEPDPSFWIRAPCGVSFLFSKVPVEAFIESGLTNRVYPWVYIRPIIAIGGRWYF